MRLELELIINLGVKEALEIKDLEFSKTKYLECRFNSKRRKSNKLVTIASEEAKQINFADWDRSHIINGEIEEGITNRIKKKRWLKWWNASRMIWDKRIPTKLKENSIGIFWDMQCSIFLSVGKLKNNISK